MKVLSIQDAAPQLGKLITDALNGEAIYLTNGDRQVQLTPRVSDEAEIDFDSPRLKEALRLGLEGTPEPYSPELLVKDCREALGKRKTS
jgi:hypothetical protein